MSAPEVEILHECAPVGSAHVQREAYREIHIATQTAGTKKASLVLKTVGCPHSQYIRIPLGKVQTFKRGETPSDYNVAVPLEPLLFTDLEQQDKQQAITLARRLSQEVLECPEPETARGWIYVYRNGHLWRELKVVGRGYLRDVSLRWYQGRDCRAAHGEADRRIVVPHKVGGVGQLIEMAYSEVQWSWAQINALGGLDPTYGGYDPDHGPAEGEADNASAERARRLQAIPLAGYSERFTTPHPFIENLATAPRYFELEMDRGKGIPGVYLRDPLTVARRLAFEHQQAWRDLEDYIGELADPQQADKHPFAPWFDSAFLANQYFFVEHPEIDPPGGAPAQPSEAARRRMNRARRERQKWREQLSLGDIQKALGTEARARLRQRIEQARQALVDYLDAADHDAHPLIAALDDYARLPAYRYRRIAERDARDYGALYTLCEQLFARLGEHPRSLDLALDTEIPTQAERYAMERDDPGACLLRRIADPEGGHALHGRLFAPDTPAQAQAPAGTTQAPPPASPLFSAEKLSVIGLPAMLGVGAWVEHYARVAAEFSEIQARLVRVLNAVGQGLEEIISAGFDLAEAVEGRDAGKAVLLRNAVIGADPDIRARVEQTRSELMDMDAKPTTSIPVHAPDGKLIATTTLAALHRGHALSSGAWLPNEATRDLRPLLGRVELWAANSARGAPALARWAVDKGLWNRAILPVVAVLEAWNLQRTFSAYWKEKGGEVVTRRTGHQLANSLVNVGAVSTIVWEERHKALHRAAEKEAGGALRPTERYLIAQGFARGLGAAAGAYGAALSVQDMLRNASKGDDAAIAHGVMAVGFSTIMVAETAGLAALFLEKYKVTLAGRLVFGVAGGPWLWIGLIAVFVGVALLTWVFAEDTPLEEWLRLGPFSRKGPVKLTRTTSRDPNGDYYIHFATYRRHQGQLRLTEDHRILRIPGGNGPVFWQDEKEGVYQRMSDGSERQIGRIGERLDLTQYEDHGARFNGFNGEDTPDKVFHYWRTHPQTAYRSLVASIYTPTVDLRLDEFRINPVMSRWEAVLIVHIPNYLDNRTRLHMELYTSHYRSSARTWVWELGYDEVRLLTPEGSGARTVQVRWPMAEGRRAKARVWLDLHGDGQLKLPERLVLPTGKDEDPTYEHTPIEVQAGPPPTRTPLAL